MKTPFSMIDTVARSVCGHGVVRTTSLAGGGMNETYRAELASGRVVVVRIAHQDAPWFGDEAHLMTQARAAGVPTPEVFGLEHREYGDDVLSFSVQELLPGRSLDEILPLLSDHDVEQLLLDAGEKMARVHSVVPDGEHGIPHPLRHPESHTVAAVSRSLGETFGPAAAATVERGADFLCEAIAVGVPSLSALGQGDFLPKNLLVDEGAIVGVLDWEFAGPASPAFDLARWEVTAGEPLDDQIDVLRRGYERITSPKEAADDWTAAFAIDWSLELLAWKNPASQAQIRRCIEVIDRFARR
ncbi:phosphotransferase family protein [uncultured Friedmanniella sp.]|uniref:phosphotransferase family protein n=1 Tax=uncultured Friedmanniella sp. TaxID=335381 RepID=UPI0035CA2D04